MGSGIPALGNSKFQHNFHSRDTGPVWQIFFQDELKKHMTFIRIYCLYFTAHFELSNLQKVAIPKLFGHSLWLPLTYVGHSLTYAESLCKARFTFSIFPVSFSGSHLMFSCHFPLLRFTQGKGFICIPQPCRNIFCKHLHFILFFFIFQSQLPWHLFYSLDSEIKSKIHIMVIPYSRRC